MPSLRLQRLQKILSKGPVKTLLVTDLTNIRYLTGLPVSAGLLCVQPRNVILFVDARYTEMASLRAEGAFTVADPAKLKHHLQEIRTIGFEAEHVTVARLARLQRLIKNKKLVQMNDLVEGLRRKKDSEELHSIRAACALTKKVLAAIPRLLRIGMTERQLASKIFSLSMDLGAEGMAFDTIVGFGESTSRPHHSPTDRRLQKSDIVQIDMGVKVGGYCSDYSRVYFMTRPTSEQKKVCRALEKAKKSAEKLLKAGVTNRRLDAEARRVLKEFGYDKEFSHSLGHGVGLDIHEGVTLSGKAPELKLLKHEVVTIEPGLYFPGKFGIRLEDTHIVE